MDAHQERVVAEKKDLDEKWQKLGLFLCGKLHNALPADEQQRLRRQFDLMQQYAGVLQERIDHFPS